LGFFGIFSSVFVFFVFFNTDVGVGFGFLKYHDIGFGFRLPTRLCAEVESIDRVDSSRVDRSNRSSEREVESVDNTIDSKLTFGSGADSADHGEQ